jgi:hypothetical protein
MAKIDAWKAAGDGFGGLRISTGQGAEKDQVAICIWINREKLL